MPGGEAELADDAASGCDGWDRGAVVVWLREGPARPGHPRASLPQRQRDQPARPPRAPA